MHSPALLLDAPGQSSILAPLEVLKQDATQLHISCHVSGMGTLCVLFIMHACMKACMCLQCKLDAIATYGGKIRMCTPTMDAREAECRRIEEDTGAHFVPPYNDPRIISGQVGASWNMVLFIFRLHVFPAER